MEGKLISPLVPEVSWGNMEQSRSILHSVLVPQRKELKKCLLLISLCVCVYTFTTMFCVNVILRTLSALFSEA